MAEDHPNGQPEYSKAVRIVDGFKDRLSVLYALTASVPLSTVLGEAVASTDVGVTIISDGTVAYNPNGTASAANGFLPTVYTINGGKTVLDLVRLYAAASTNISVIVFEVVD